MSLFTLWAQGSEGFWVIESYAIVVAPQWINVPLSESMPVYRYYRLSYITAFKTLPFWWCLSGTECVNSWNNDIVWHFEDVTNVNLPMWSSSSLTLFSEDSSGWIWCGKVIYFTSWAKYVSYIWPNMSTYCCLKSTERFLLTLIVCSLFACFLGIKSHEYYFIQLHWLKLIQLFHRGIDWHVPDMYGYVCMLTPTWWRDWGDQNRISGFFQGCFRPEQHTQ